MKALHLLVLVLVSVALVACQPVQPPPQIDPVQASIDNAMSAAPLAIAGEATILDWPADANSDLVTLREGSNGWTCFTDSPGTPTNDPMCLDAMSMVWFEAYIAGGNPEITSVGIAYLLQGGTTASNSDPYAMEPAAGEAWINDPPSMMVFVPGGPDPAIFGADPMSGGPYIMWSGTPYAHLMVPVADAHE